MTTVKSGSARELTRILSDAVHDIPAWARGLMVVAGLVGVVIVVIGSLKGGQEQTIGVDKLLHFGGYATLAAIFVIGLRTVLFVPALALLVGLGWAIEFLQPLNGRSFDVSDGIANMVGVAVGATLGLITRLFFVVMRTQVKRARLNKHRRKYASGSVILRQGAPLLQFFVIERGQVRLSREVDGQQTVLGTMGPGEVFGLLGVIQAQPQYATVEAVTETTLYGLDLNDLIESSGGKSEPIASVLAVMAEHLRKLADRVVETQLTPDATEGPP